MSKKNKYKRKDTKKINNGTEQIKIDETALDEDALESYLSGSKREIPRRIITDKQARRGKMLRLTLRILMLISAGIWVVFMNIVAGIGMIIKSQSEIHEYGVPMLIATGLIIVGITLALRKYNIASIAFSIVGMIAVFVVVSRMCNIVDALAISDDEFRMMSEVYKFRHYPTGIAVLFQVLLCIAQYFSYDASVKRAENKRKKLAEKYKQAPKILGDDED